MTQGLILRHLCSILSLKIESEDIPTTEGYFEFLKQEFAGSKASFNSDFDSLRHNQSQYPPFIDQCLLDGNSDSKTENLLILQPLSSHAKWSRYDDPLDYIDSLDNGSESELRTDIKILPTGIGYYSNLWMDKDSGQWIDSEKSHFLNFIPRSSWANFNPNDSSGEAMSKLAGFSDWKEAHSQAVSFVPNEIRLLAKYLDIFTSPEVSYQLSPIYCTFWS
jgi:hypothetical protein